MKAEFIKNQYHGHSFCVGGTTYATVYLNGDKTYDIYLTGNLFNPVELPSASHLIEALAIARAAVFAHLVEVVAAVGEELAEGG